MNLPEEFKFKHDPESDWVHTALLKPDGSYHIVWDEKYTYPSWSNCNAEEIFSFMSEADGWVILSQKDVQIADKPVVSDGGSSSYYALTITNKAGDTLVCELGDIIRVVVGNDADLFNIIKACRRAYESSQGRGKEGVSIEYDMNKVKYFADEFKHWNKQ